MNKMNTLRNSLAPVKASTRFLGMATFVLLFSAGTALRVDAAPGELDPSFGSGGKVTTNFFNDTEEARDVAVQPDGKIVVVGPAFNPGGGTGFDFLLIRYNPDGSLDTTFGSGGKVITDFFGNFDSAEAVVIQNDGKIVVAGEGSDDIALVRYNPNGTLDSTFGSGGKVTTDFFGSFDQARDLAIQSDGRLVVTGTADGPTHLGDFVLVRYNADGTLDLTFGSGGKVLTDFAGLHDEPNALVIQTDGRIVVVGLSNIGGKAVFALARYNTDGGLDPAFGVGGKTTTDSLSGNAFDVALQGNGKIVVAGAVGSDFALARYDTDGGLDPTFGVGGKVTTNFFSFSAQATGVAIQVDGRIVAVGEIFFFGSRSDFALARYNADGSLDATFGSGGQVVTDFFGSLDGARDVAIQADGKIVAAGFAEEFNTGLNVGLARYLASGAPGSSANLSIAVTGSPSQVAINNFLNYTITVSNAGPDDANGVLVEYRLPFDVAFVSCGATAGGVCGGSGGIRDVAFTSLPAGTSATITIVAFVQCFAGNGPATVTSIVRAVTADSTFANNVARATNVIISPPPVISEVSVNRPVLWPPNHQMVEATVSYSATDSCGLDAFCFLSVTSNEPENGTDDGDTAPDWEVMDAHHVLLRAERAGGGPGRVYTIAVTCFGSNGGTSIRTVTVSVPLRQPQ